MFEMKKNDTCVQIGVNDEIWLELDCVTPIKENIDLLPYLKIIMGMIQADADAEYGKKFEYNVK